MSSVHTSDLKTETTFRYPQIHLQSSSYKSHYAMLSFKLCNRFYLGLNRKGSGCRSRIVLNGANEPGEVFGKLKDRQYLDMAAKKFALGESMLDKNL